MRHLLKIAGLAALLGAGTLAAAEPAAAQFRVEIGPDRPRVERRIIERRGFRPSRRVCRTEYRERIRPNGVIVRRPVEVCRIHRF